MPFPVVFTCVWLDHYAGTLNRVVRASYKLWCLISEKGGGAGRVTSFPLVLVTRSIHSCLANEKSWLAGIQTNYVALPCVSLCLSACVWESSNSPRQRRENKIKQKQKKEENGSFHRAWPRSVTVINPCAFVKVTAHDSSTAGQTHTQTRKKKKKRNNYIWTYNEKAKQNVEMAILERKKEIIRRQHLSAPTGLKSQRG